MKLALKFSQARHRGFSLLELAISLALVGVLLVGFMAYWRSSAESRVTQVDRDLLLVAKRSLIGFAHANYRLPCPAVDAGGLEVCGNGAQIGQLPWRTLGLPNPAAGQMKYGVYRAPNATAPWLDLDLAIATDRLVPLNNITGNGPAAPAPPIPPVVSQTPVNAYLIGNVNLQDFCYAARLASASPVNPAGLAVVDNSLASKVQPVAFVVALPGLLDADGDGDPFDGHQHTASQALPQFDASSRTLDSKDDDRVLAMGFDEVFGALRCGEAVSAISHAHVNAATAAAIMAQGMVDYQNLLGIQNLLAGAGIAEATASVDSSTAGLAMAVATSANAIGEAIASNGAASELIAAAAAAVVSNTAAVAAAGVSLTLAVALQGVTAEDYADSQGALVTPSAQQATQADADWRQADQYGF